MLFWIWNHSEPELINPHLQSLSQGVQQYLFTCIQDHPVWRNERCVNNWNQIALYPTINAKTFAKSNFATLHQIEWVFRISVGYA